MSSIKLCFINHTGQTQIIESPVQRPIDLDSNFSIIEAELFMKSILEFNDLNLDQKLIDGLNAEEDIALEGGLHFSSSSHDIYPSCCSDFYEWTEAIHDIRNNSSPWMGHDPSPYIDFINNSFVVWNDENTENDNSYKIEYSIQDIDRFENEIKSSIVNAIPFIVQWVNNNSDLDILLFEQAIRKYIHGMQMSVIDPLPT